VSNGPRRRLLVAAVLLSGALVCLAAGVLLGIPRLPTLGAALLVGGLVIWKPAYSWTAVLTVLFLVALFIPMRKYALGGNLPFQPEPYRLLVLVVFSAWALSLLADARVRLRRTPLDAAVLGVALVILLSLAANLDRAVELQAVVTKTVILFATHVLLFFLITSVVTTRDQLHKLIKVLVVAGAAIAALAVLELRLGYNPYEAVLGRVPFLLQLWSPGTADRAFRAAGPTQHPIELAAVLVMLVPFALALAHTTARKRWWIAAFMMTVAAFATLSRTAVVMLVVVAVVCFWLRRADSLRIAPLVVALVIAIHFVVPGALGNMKSLFFPEGGLIAQQSVVWAPDLSEDLPIWCSYAGRAADIGPTFDAALERPFLGQGFGTRVTVDDPFGDVKANACVLDNQWLGTLLDVGFVGALVWAWLFVYFIRRVAAAAKRADAHTAWLLTAFAASVAAFGVGMFLFDAFAFVQSTLLLFILLAFGAVLLASVARRGRVALPAP
jgi:polysaccharide biosynthesis protein PslJ